MFRIRILNKSSKNLPENGVHIPDLFWHLSRNLIRSDWLFEWGFPITEVITEKHQRETNKEPETQKGQHRREGNSTAAMFSPNKYVEEKTHRSNNSGVQDRRLRGK